MCSTRMKLNMNDGLPVTVMCVMVEIFIVNWTGFGITYDTYLWVCLCVSRDLK